MSFDHKVRTSLENWLIKTPGDVKPRRITNHDIAKIVEGIQDQRGLARDVISASLVEKFSEWIVQRARGERPSGFANQDAERLLDLLPDTFFTRDLPEPVPVPVLEAVPQPFSESDLKSVPLPESLPDVDFDTRQIEPVIEQKSRKKVPENPVAKRICPPEFLFHLEHGL